MPKNSLFYSLLQKQHKSKKKNSNAHYFTFKDIGRVIQELLKNFYQNKFLAYPFSEIDDDKYETLLQQTVTIINNIFSMKLNFDFKLNLRTLMAKY